MTIVYPPDEITPAGVFMMLSGRYPSYQIDSATGNVRFHLMGGQAPWPGLQDGVVCEALKSYDPPFENLDSQGAHQDGVTYNDTVYGATEFDFILKTSSRTLRGARRAFADWLDTWDPKQQVKLTRYTEIDGHWWCYVRKAKPMTDDITIRKRGQRMTWTAQNDLTFWQSVPSVCTFQTQHNSDSDNFERTNTTSLGAGWDQFYTGSGGLCAIPDGHNATLSDAGGSIRTVVNTRVGFVAATDYYIVTEKHANFMEAPLGGAAYNDVWARTSSTGEFDGWGVRARFGFNGVTVSKFVGGVETALGFIPTSYFNFNPPSVSLQVGTEAGPRSYVPMINGVGLGTISDPGFDSPVGVDYRGGGFGFECGTRVGGGQTSPSQVASWSAEDNLALQTGFQTLTNRGDQFGWASHLCYGPGIFRFGDGPDSTNMISFGPLEAGQVALITTLPRLRSIVDLTPTPVAASAQNLDLFQTIVKDLIDFATAGNVPPLLQQFESAFGIRPPQGVLYSLLKGRFTNPIPPKPEGSNPVESHIAVQIANGGPSSKVISSLTPFKRMPVQ